jgi:glyoxylase-like metal-dependent hydrolase (beta-lactamase superfamily II)/8-oxo-dGTP pyrophosphatase MutT (NUDIX family)
VTSGSAVRPIPAATVVLLRPDLDGGPPQILLTQRPASMAFAADLHVFPGGRIDAGDADARATDRSVLAPDEAAERMGRVVPPDVAIAAHLAAVRELYEEAGVLLADQPGGTGGRRRPGPTDRTRLLEGRSTIADLGEAFDLRFRTDRLVPIGRWTTPPILPRRFDTHFFAAELPPGSETSFVGGEVVADRWLSARAALEAMADGGIAMWVPTSATLQRLEHAAGIDEIRDHLGPGPAVAPRVVGERPDLVRIVLTGAGAVAGQSVNAYLVGRRELVIVDPGDPSEEAAEAILAAVAATDGRLVAIALTHADPDHAAGAEGLALRLGLPVLGGPGAGRDVPYEVRELGDGEALPGDGGVTAVHTPGPRPEHLAFVLRDGPSLVGDIVGGRGSRSLVGPADDAAWRASLERLRARGVTVHYPGHGEPPASAGE